jgi:hypothetical protein
MGNFVMADVRTEIRHGTPGVHGSINVSDNLFVNGYNGTFGATNENFSGSGFSVGGNVWTDANISVNGSNGQGRAGNMRFGTRAYVPNSQLIAGTTWRNNNGTANGVHFTSNDVLTPTPNNKIPGATNLDELAGKVVECNRPNGTTELCVPDPLILPEDAKDWWLRTANKLDSMANPLNAADTAVLKGISNACLRLLRKGGNQNDNLEGKWYGCGNGSKANFTKHANQCYNDLLAYRNGELLYGDAGSQFLAVNMDGSCLGDPTPPDVFDGKFIFVFQNNVSANIKLGETAKDAAVFIYLKEGATGTMAMTGNRGDGKFRNYFIYSEKDIGGMSGSTTISGTIFLANGSKSGAITAIDVNFNKDLFDALVDAGILDKNPDAGGGGGGDGQIILPPRPDEYFIPVSSRLSVKLENKEISKEKEPANTAATNLEKSILVMPRLVRITRDMFTKYGTSLRDYYTYMYLNGAVASDTLSGPQSCGKLNGSGILNPSSSNEDGLYECIFATGGIKHTSFFVQVAGESSQIALSIDPTGKKINIEDPNPECEVVSLKLDDRFERPVSAKITISMGSGWTKELESVCVLNEPTLSCTIPANTQTLKILRVCSQNASEGKIILTLVTPQEGEGYIIDGNKNTSTISLDLIQAKVERQEVSGTFTVCPNGKQPTSPPWVTVNCMGDGQAEPNNNSWECNPNQSAPWSITIGAGEACAVVGNATSGTVNIGLGGTTSYFNASLEWKSYKVTVTGADRRVRLITTDNDVPAAERNQLCDGATGNGCKIYHGATYTVRHDAGPVNWECSLPNCEGYLTATGTTETITAGSDVSITLSPLVIGLVSCELFADQTVIVGQPLASNLSTYVNSYVLNGPCGTATYTYSASSSNTNTIGSTITITMGVTCSENPATTGNTSVLCDGNIKVVDETQPNITCEWGNGSTDYYIGSAPSVKVAVSNGSVTTCAAPTVSANNFTGVTWGAPNNNGTVGSTTNYTLNGSSITEQATNRSVTVQTVCTGGKYPGNKTAQCTGKNVGNKPPCEAATSPNNFSNICPGIELGNVKWNQYPNSPVPAGCYFVTDINYINTGTGNWRINGNTVTGNNCYNCHSGWAKIDGGYYIYHPSNSTDYGRDVTLGSKPVCAPDPEPELSCSWNPATNAQVGRFVSNSNVVEGGAIPTPTVTCGSTNVNSANVTFSPAQPFGTTVAPQQYNNITAIVATGCGTTSKSANCGSLLVRYAPSVNQCNFTNATGVAGSSLTKPTITLTDQSNICSNNGSSAPNASWTGEAWKYTAPSAGTFNWASLPVSATYPTVYNNFTVSGSCGDYGNVTSGNCTGNVTVTAPTIPPCQYDPSWCGGIALNNVTTNVSNTTINEGTHKCVFIKGLPSNGSVNAAADQFAGRQVRVNGTGYNIDGNALQDHLRSGNGKVDGGYYIYVGAWNYIQFSNATAGTPECLDFGTTPSSSSAAGSSSASGGGGIDVCSGADKPIPAGTHTVSVAASCGGGQFLCWGNDNIAKTVSFNGQEKSGDALRYGNSGWVENWGNPGGKPFTATLVVSAGTVNCRTDW